MYIYIYIYIYILTRAERSIRHADRKSPTRPHTRILNGDARSRAHARRAAAIRGYRGICAKPECNEPGASDDPGNCAQSQGSQPFNWDRRPHAWQRGSATRPPRVPMLSWWRTGGMRVALRRTRNAGRRWRVCPRVGHSRRWMQMASHGNSRRTRRQARGSDNGSTPCTIS